MTEPEDKNADKKFRDISRKLRDKSGNIKDYEVSEEPDYEPSPFFSSRISRRDYTKAQKLKEKLLSEYSDKNLEEVIRGEEFGESNNKCYRIINEETLDFSMVDSQKAINGILSNLKLVYGIGEITENNLKKNGVDNIEDLIENSTFKDNALKFMEILRSKDPCMIINEMSHWLPGTHPHVLFSSSLFEIKNFLFLDIETMGLFTRPIILIGVGAFNGGQLTVTQYLLRNISEEPAALFNFLSHINEDTIFVSFNGKSFDIPYINERLRYYGFFEDLNRAHLDILHFSRRAWGDDLPDCRLKTLEKFLSGLDRTDDIPSEMVPEFYETFMNTGNPGPLIPIIEHNRQDIVTLADIFGKLHEEWEKYC